MAVVLPAPLRPRKPRTSPWTTSRLRSFKAVSDPYCFVRPRIEMAGVCASVVLTRSLRKSVAPSLCSRATQKDSVSLARHLDMARSFSSRWVRAHSALRPTSVRMEAVEQRRAICGAEYMIGDCDWLWVALAAVITGSTERPEPNREAERSRG